MTPAALANPYDSPELPDLLQLAKRIHAGDRAAERELVERYRRVIHAMVRRRCRVGESQLDDLVQDIMTAMLQRLRREPMPEQSVVAEYLRATTHHRCLSHYRSAALRNEVQSGQLPEAVAQVDLLSDALMRERAGQVRQLVESLPTPRDREVLRLFYLEQLDRDDVCSRLQIDADHFRRVLHRARQRMLLHLSPDQMEQLRS